MKAAAAARSHLSNLKVLCVTEVARLTALCHGLKAAHTTVLLQVCRVTHRHGTAAGQSRGRGERLNEEKGDGCEAVTCGTHTRQVNKT